MGPPYLISEEASILNDTPPAFNRGISALIAEISMSCSTHEESLISSTRKSFLDSTEVGYYGANTQILLNSDQQFESILHSQNVLSLKMSPLNCILSQ
jgi:hypothetical protein